MATQGELTMTTPTILNEIDEQIDELEREDWHDDDRSRRATINGLKIARRIIERAAS